MPPPLSRRRLDLATRLRTVRASAFRSGNAFARHLGWVQSRVSKLETGAQLPTEDDLRAWVSGARASREVADELFELLAAARVEYVNARDVQRAGGLAGRQALLRELESTATTLAEYQPSIVPGLVQTAAYARELLALPGAAVTHGASETEVEAIVAERIRRQGVLYEPGHHVQLVIGEAALYSPPRSMETLRGQLDRLLTVGGLASVELGILPRRTPMAALMMGGFALHDDRVVLVETLTSEQRLEEPGEVGVYREVFQALHEAAAGGDEAIRRIRAALDDTND